MPKYESEPEYRHGDADSLGVLVVNLGTPDAPTSSAVRRYLAEFLWDPRIVELPRPLWWLILNGFILRVRPSRSAKAYREIWTEQGSPLLVYCREIAAELGAVLDNSSRGAVHVALGMKTYRKTGPPAWQRRLVLLLWGMFGATLLLFAAWAMLLWIEMDRIEDCTERGGHYDTVTDECIGARWE